jgi:hypothetical protein
LDDIIEITIPRTGIPVLAHDCERQSTDTYDCCNQKYSRHAFRIFHVLSSTNIKSGEGEFGYECSLGKSFCFRVTFLKVATLWLWRFLNNAWSPVTSFCIPTAQDL